MGGDKMKDFSLLCDSFKVCLLKAVAVKSITLSERCPLSASSLKTSGRSHWIQTKIIPKTVLCLIDGGGKMSLNIYRSLLKQVAETPREIPLTELHLASVRSPM